MMHKRQKPHKCIHKWIYVYKAEVAANTQALLSQRARRVARISTSCPKRGSLRGLLLVLACALDERANCWLVVELTDLIMWPSGSMKRKEWTASLRLKELSSELLDGGCVRVLRANDG